MGIDRGLLSAMADHKSKALGPHFVFSVDGSDFPDKNELKLSHKEVLKHLVGAGYDAHEVKGHDSVPRKYIIIYDVHPDDVEQLHTLAARLGQKNSIYSTGKRHERRYHHGVGDVKKDLGEGITMYKSKPSDKYISLPGEQDHMAHNFQKSEDAETYRKMAESGMDLLFPVTIKGRTHMSDTGIVYHITIKLFEPKTDDPNKIDEIAKKLELLPPDPTATEIKTSTIKGRNGNTMHILELHGPTADRIIQYHQEFKDVGNPMGREFQPHVTVEKSLWDRFHEHGPINAHDAGVEFGPAELRQGNKILFSYKPNTETLSPTKRQEASKMTE